MPKAPRRSGSASSRDRLLSAALDLLATEGWSGLTSRKVASAAGVNVGLIHYYFGGMPDLRRAAMAHAVEHVATGKQRAVLEAATPADAAAALGASFEAPRSGQEPLIAAVLAGAAVDPELQAVVGEGLRQARTQLTEWLCDRGTGWPADRREAVAALLMAAVDGLLLHSIADSDMPAADALHVLADLLHETPESREGAAR